MKKTIGLYEFREAFANMGRTENFSYEGAEALFDYLEEVDEDMELDVIAICCDYTEYANFGEIDEAYHLVDEEEELKDELIKARLLKNTLLLEFDGGIIIQAF